MGGAVGRRARLGHLCQGAPGSGSTNSTSPGKSADPGVGGQLLAALVDQAGHMGFFKIVGWMLAPNQAALRAARSCGFRTVGVLPRHGKIDGEWQDIIEVERLLDDAAGG